MLSTMGRSSRRGGATRPHQAVIAKRTMAAIPVRSATDQRGGKLWRITLFTGQVTPHVSTTAASSTAARRRDTPPCASSGAGRDAGQTRGARGPPGGRSTCCEDAFQHPAYPSPTWGGGPPSITMVAPVMKRRRGGGQEDARVGDLLHLAPEPHADAGRDRVVGLLGGGRILLGEHAQVALGLHRAGARYSSPARPCGPRPSRASRVKVTPRPWGARRSATSSSSRTPPRSRRMLMMKPEPSGPSSAGPPTCSRRKCR